MPGSTSQPSSQGMSGSAGGLPAPKLLRDLLEDQTERAVQVRLASPYLPQGTKARTLAVYVDARLGTTAVLAADLPFSVHASAAAAGVKAAATSAVLADGWLGPVLLGRLQLFLGSVGQVLRADAGPVRLHAVYPPAQAAPADVTARVVAMRRRLDLRVEISGYGAGRLSLVSG